MNAIEQLFTSLNITANVFHNGQYCGNWQVDTSGSGYMNFHVITHGRCYFHTDDGQVFTLEKGDMVLMPCDSGHFLSPSADDVKTHNTENSVPVSAQISGDGPVLVCGYFVHDHPFASLINRDLPPYIVLKRDGTENAALYSAMQLLMSESLTPSDSVSVNSVVLNKVAELICLLLTKDVFSSQSSLIGAITHPKLSSSIQAIHDHPEKKWTVDDLASIAFMSRSAYAALFKSVTDVSPLQYITQWRCVCAGRDLADPNQSMISIANRYGYDSEASFSKAFKRIMGQSPGAMRNR